MSWASVIQVLILVILPLGLLCGAILISLHMFLDKKYPDLEETKKQKIVDLAGALISIILVVVLAIFIEVLS